MIRELETLGLALVAAFAMSAVGAAAASAESFAFHSEVEHTTLLGAGVGTQQFTVDAGSTTCGGVEYEGTVTSQEFTEAALTPKFTSCTVDPAGTADITVNSCRYVLAPVTKSGGTYKAKLSIACNEGDSVTVAVTLAGVTKCTIHFPPQELGEVTVSEVSEGDIKVAAEIGGIDYSQTAGTGAGKCSQAEGTTNGTFKGEMVLAGSLGEAQVGIGMQAQKVVLLASSPTKFSGKKDDEQTITINNESGNDLTKGLEYLVAENGNAFELTADTCGKGIAKGKSCSIKLKCKTLSGKVAYIVAETQAPDPHGVTASKLENC
jgi:hypothetical protein